jgi:hypothetical protein
MINCMLCQTSYMVSREFGQTQLGRQQLVHHSYANASASLFA